MISFYGYLTVQENINLYFEQKISSKDKNFANGRLVRIFYEDLIMNHARRVVNAFDPDREELSTIKAVDVIFTVNEENKGF